MERTGGETDGGNWRGRGTDCQQEAWLGVVLIFDGLLIFLLCYHGRPLTLTERRGEKLRAGPAHVHTGGGGGGRREEGGERSGNEFLTAPWKYLTTTITDRETAAQISL